MHLIHNMQLKSAPNNPVNAIGKTILLDYLDSLRISVHFVVVEDIAFLQLIGTSSIDRFVEGIFLMERSIVSIWSCKIAMFFRIYNQVEPAGCISECLEAEAITTHQQYSNTKTPLFGVAKDVAILPGIEASVSVPKGSVRRVHIALHPNFM